MTDNRDDIMQNKSRAVCARSRSGMYRLISILFRSEPTRELFDQLRRPEFLDALLKAGVNLPDELFSQSDQRIFTDLETEYARLFIGPGKHIPPYESVHRADEEEGLYGRSTVRVKQFIESTGFRFRPEYTGLPDHISTEMEFMQTLAGWEAEAWDSSDNGFAMKCRKLEERFLRDHLQKWVPDFCMKILNETTVSFYVEIAGLTRDFLAAEEIHLLSSEYRPAEKATQTTSKTSMNPYH